MNRRHRVVRASFYLSLALPFAALACGGDNFTAGPGDGGEDGGIVFGDGGGEAHDATTGDGSADARHDGPGDGGAGHDGTADGHSCPPGWLTCSDGGCAQEGPTNCGSCGNDCTTLPHVMNPQCTAGQCVFTCAQGWQNCTTNQNAGCQTNITTQGNCGACNVTCSGNTPVCMGTSCVSSCTSGQTLCDGGTCVDTTSNPQDCNGCGNVCPNSGPPNSQPTCTNSVCGWACAPTYLECNGNSCIPTVPDTTAGLFVAPGGPAASCGSVSAPCGTISAALQYVTATRNIIYVAQSSTPYVEQVTLVPNVTIQGGWVYTGAGQWSNPSCALPSKTVIQAPPGADRVVIANYVGSASLDTLTVDNNTTAAAGTSTYGIFAANAQAGQTSLTLTNVDVSVSAGGGGNTGGQGPAGTSPPPSCGSLDGADGGTGGVGNGALQGTYDVSGFHPAQGGQGLPGTAGDNGTPAPPKPCVNTYPGTFTTNPNCCSNSGGCVACSGSPTTTFCSSQGTNGCGSPGATGGFGGTGGGASIGIFVFQESVILNNVNITTGMGGQGGNGGPGGSGQTGSAGTTGAKSTSQYVSACTTDCASTPCLCKPTALAYVAGGGPGGNGGTGGTGGQGGGGAGGDSLCFYQSAAGAVTVNGWNCTTPATAAPGGNNSAASGRLGQHN